MDKNAVRITSASVNHNTSAYMELMLRSLFAHERSGPALSVTVYDNQSEDDQSGLRTYAEQVGVPVLPSGFDRHTENNSHGDVLRRFVLDHPDCTHYLFLDADVVFIEDGTLATMLDELEAAPDAFGIGPRMSWDGLTELPEDLLRSNPNVYENRLHPCCALIRNTPVFRKVVEAVGLSCVKYLWATNEEYWDTFRLMTTVMRTHGLRHIRSSKMIIHFFAVSYAWDPPEWLAEKARRRDQMLEEMRAIG